MGEGVYMAIVDEAGRVKETAYHTPIGKRTYDRKPIGAEIEEKAAKA